MLMVCDVQACDAMMACISSILFSLEQSVDRKDERRQEHGEDHQINNGFKDPSFLQSYSSFRPAKITCPLYCNADGTLRE